MAGGGAPGPGGGAAAGGAGRGARRERPAAPSAAVPPRRAGSRRRPRTAGTPIEHSVNIGVFLGTALRGAGGGSLEILRALGAGAAWRRRREAQPEGATQ